MADPRSLAHSSSKMAAPVKKDGQIQLNIHSQKRINKIVIKSD